MMGRMKSTAELLTRTRPGVEAYTQEQDRPMSSLVGDTTLYEAPAVRPKRAKVLIDPETGFPYLNFSVGRTFTAEEIAEMIAEDE